MRQKEKERKKNKIKIKERKKKKKLQMYDERQWMELETVARYQRGKA
jgi:hypothetical protein